MQIHTITIPCTGYSIVADWYDGEAADILLVLPGYTSSKKAQRELVGVICGATGYAALVIDYSGHGESPFELRDTRPAQHFLEVIEAFGWLHVKHPEARITVLGSSYGGFLAAQLTKYRSFDRVVLRVPAIYKPDAFYDLWSKRIDNPEQYDKELTAYRNDEAALAKHPLLARAASFSGKSLVVIHGKDALIPAATTNAYIAAFNADSFVAPAFSHNMGDDLKAGRVSELQLQAYKQKIIDWLFQTGQSVN